MNTATDTEYGACAVCGVSVPKELLKAQRGRCAAHVNDEVAEWRGCAECGHPCGHYRGCAWCE